MAARRARSRSAAAAPGSARRGRRETRNETALIQYASVRARRRSEHAAERAGPTAQLTFSIVCRSAFAVPSSSSGDEVRDARVDRRAGRSRSRGPRRARARRSGRRSSRTAARAKTAARSEVGGDHQLAPLEPVEQRAEREPDDDRRAGSRRRGPHRPRDRSSCVP